MIDLASTLPQQLADPTLYDLRPSEAPTVAIRRPRPSLTRRAAAWIGPALGGLVASVGIAAVALGIVGVAIVVGLWPL